jgi:hypothetical protein
MNQNQRNYKETVTRKQREHGEKFSTEALNPDFIPYYENQKRVEVDFGYEKKRGTIGITTGWKPCFLLMLTKRSLGSSYTIGKADKVVWVQ